MEATQNITTLKTKLELRQFMGLINICYRDMWIRQSDVLAPLSRLVSNTTTWHWTDVEQKAFDTMKCIIFVDLGHDGVHMLAILCHLILDLDKESNVAGMVTLDNLAITTGEAHA